ncbi:MAG: hypothetical protein PHW15_01445 [Patescibacteria group bacterium]|jgi:hypothetical protein|nr:hypothetical protein [Patescibacteria group bacterium]MDD5173065.1 hypothetical protein [Patescibacteria group bacterium]
MQIKIPDISINIDKLIKRCGYAELRNRKKEISYVRRLRGYQYPRFHIYLENGYANLHLDQKKPCYQGSRAHSGEYDSEAVKEESERIKAIISEYNN